MFLKLHFQLIAVGLLLAAAGCVSTEEASIGVSTQSLNGEVAVDIQSNHPYVNFARQSWDIEAPDRALRVIIHFDEFDTETGFDFVDLIDADGEVVHHLSGRHDGESFAVPGNSVRIVFTSDLSVTRWGFSITRYTYEYEDTRPYDHRPFCNAIGTRSEGWYWGDTGELIKFERCVDMPEPECGAIGSRSEGWYVPDGHLIVWDNCHQTVRIAIEGENCGPSIGFSCHDNLYCQGVPEGLLGGTGTCHSFGYCEEVEDCSAEGNNWIHPLCVGYATCDSETNQCGWECDTEPLGPWSWTTFLLRDIESAHPYENDMDENWEIHHDGATKIRVHFQRLSTEAGYDHVVISGNREERALMLDGHHEDIWTEELGGDSLIINLQTDSSVTGWGLLADMVSIYEQLPAGMCNRHEDCEPGLMCHPHHCFSPYAPCYGDCIRDNHCDDGEPISCRMMIPRCEEETILAHQNGCYACVDPETCEPPSTGHEGDRCRTNDDCDGNLRCKAVDDDGKGQCQDELWCAPETVEDDCAEVIHIAVPGSWFCSENLCAWQPGMTRSRFVASGLPLDIPDNNTTGVSSTIEIAGMAPCELEVTVDLSIDHTYRGDLRVELFRPDGSSEMLSDREGGSADDLLIEDQTVTGHVGGNVGTWTLTVSDYENNDVGTLEFFALAAECR